MDSFLAGNFVGYTNESVDVVIANRQIRYFVLVTCSHELKHLELYAEGVPPIAHHSVMAERGFKAWTSWHWYCSCFTFV